MSSPYSPACQKHSILSQAYVNLLYKTQQGTALSLSMGRKYSARHSSISLKRSGTWWCIRERSQPVFNFTLYQFNSDLFDSIMGRGERLETEERKAHRVVDLLLRGNGKSLVLGKSSTGESKWKDRKKAEFSLPSFLF